jgi:formylmethanofuran dehydrogenase subunit A
MPELLIKNGRVIDPASGRDETADVLIRDGAVAAVGSAIHAAGAELFDASGLVVAPGFRTRTPESCQAICRPGRISCLPDELPANIKCIGRVASHLKSFLRIIRESPLRIFLRFVYFSLVG